MSKKARKILQALKSSGKEGRGLISLALETGLSQSELRRFFKKYDQFCIPINGGAKYKLTEFTPALDSVDKMLALIEQERIDDRVQKSFGYGLVTGLFIANIGNFIDLFYRF